jgi:hypothetical protein
MVTEFMVEPVKRCHACDVINIVTEFMVEPLKLEHACNVRANHELCHYTDDVTQR